MGSKARGEDHRLWVVYADILEPLDHGGWPLEEAFAKLMDHVGLEPVWSQSPAATLELHHTWKGKVPIPPLGSHDTPTNPKFSSVMDRGFNAELLARESVMMKVLNSGVYGWRGQIKYSYNLSRQMEENRRRYPENFTPDGRAKIR